MGLNDVLTGIDVMQKNNFANLIGKRLGIVVNQASVNRGLLHLLDLLKIQKDLNVTAIFGPQHGLFGTTQANMIEWEGYRDKKTEIPVYSLYGKDRKPTSNMLDNIDMLVFDLQDIGSRYYTYLWTGRLCLEACAKENKKMVVFDRPNPIGGEIVEGPILNKNYRSFVGLYEIPIRHGMTMGELLSMINIEEGINCKLEVINIEGWEREFYFEDTNFPWVFPSPNMPTVDTAVVYPGFCLLEATNISEGRGTCRPFEICGAPFIDSNKLISMMNGFGLMGVIFRPIQFVPTFDKFSGKLCYGFQMHVINRKIFKPIKTAAVFLLCMKILYPKDFSWIAPPYEYEYEKMPIDILWGNSSLRDLIVSEPKCSTIKSIEEDMNRGLDKFLIRREKYLLY